VGQFPARADTAAALLIDLHEGRGAGDPLGAPGLEEEARRDAIAGLGAVLRAVTGLDPARADACVARVLDHLTRLLGELAESGGDGVMEGEEAEEGEVDDRAALVGLARAAFTHHPHRVIAFCVGCLAKPERAAGARGERDARRGARLVLTRLALVPPPRGAKLPGGDVVEDWEELPPPPAAAAAAAGARNSGSSRKGAAAGRQGGPDSWLALVLRADEGLQQWVAQAAAAAAGRAPSEARQMLNQFVQLLPPPPLPDSPPPGSPGCDKQQQQQQQQLAANGSGSLLRNGALQGCVCAPGFDCGAVVGGSGYRAQLHHTTPHSPCRPASRH